MNYVLTFEYRRKLTELCIKSSLQYVIYSRALVRYKSFSIVQRFPEERRLGSYTVIECAKFYQNPETDSTVTTPSPPSVQLYLSIPTKISVPVVQTSRYAHVNQMIYMTDLYTSPAPTLLTSRVS